MVGDYTPAKTDDYIQKYIHYVLNTGLVEDKNKMISNIARQWSYIDKRLVCIP